MAATAIASALLTLVLHLSTTLHPAGRHGVAVVRAQVIMGPDIAGRDYCRTRRAGSQCCPNRDDSCHAPILDTLCYCDEFCERTIWDCCPDYWNHCAGREPPDGARPFPTQPPTQVTSCYHNAKYYPDGSQFKDNCKQCRCSNGDVRCDGEEVCLINTEVNNVVNSEDCGWRATNYSSMWGRTLSYGITYKTGTLQPQQDVARMTEIKIRVRERLDESFDARERWPGLILPVRDQGECGASWAFSTTALASDRLAIQSEGKEKMQMSPQQLLSCDTRKQLGCKGGYLDRAWWYMRKRGVVSSECYPFDSGYSQSVGVCKIPKSAIPDKVQCPSGSRDPGVAKVQQSTPPYRISAREDDIMKEILINGPVQATFEVQPDFYAYESGVYRHCTSATSRIPSYKRKTAYHSIRIIGWGVDYSTGRPIKYWLCANSWGEEWGERGYFRILRGENESQIESFVLGVWALQANPVLYFFVARPPPPTGPGYETYPDGLTSNYPRYYPASGRRSTYHQASGMLVRRGDRYDRRWMGSRSQHGTSARRHRRSLPRHHRHTGGEEELVTATGEEDVIHGNTTATNATADDDAAVPMYDIDMLPWTDYIYYYPLELAAGVSGHHGLNLNQFPGLPPLQHAARKPSRHRGQKDRRRNTMRRKVKYNLQKRKRGKTRGGHRHREEHGRRDVRHLYNIIEELMEMLDEMPEE